MTTPSMNRAKPLISDPVAAAQIDAYLLSQEAAVVGAQPPVAILGVFGEPGCGKSTLVEERARRLGLKPHVSTASKHAGSFEGDSVAGFEQDLAEASKLGASIGRIALAVFNDIDQGVVAEKKAHHTGNSGLLIGRMQHHADQMHAGRLKPPCAIIVTGNSAKCFPDSLVRDGRWRFIEMRPTWSTRRRQLLSLVGPSLGARLAAEAVMIRYPRRPIAFLAQAAAEARQASILETYAACGNDIEKFRAAIAQINALPLTGRALWRAAVQSAAGRAAVMRRA